MEESSTLGTQHFSKLYYIYLHKFTNGLVSRANQGCGAGKVCVRTRFVAVITADTASGLAVELSSYC